MTRLTPTTELSIGTQCPVPEGQLRIAQRFSVGFDRRAASSPEGTAERQWSRSAVPSGLIVDLPLDPTLKRWAIFRCPSGTRRCGGKLLPSGYSAPSGWGRPRGSHGGTESLP